MITKYEISKDEKCARAFPDLILLEDKMICTFAEINHEDKEYNVSYCFSYDRGKSWSERKILAAKVDDNGRWDCPRICKMKDGSIIVIATWYINDDTTKKSSYIYMWKCNSNLEIIEQKKTTMTGIVPDKILELDDKWIIFSHERNTNLETIIYYSYDHGDTWSDKKIVGSDKRYNLCETSAVKIEDNTIVALMRENSDKGIDVLKMISYDGGVTWDGIYNMPIPAGHRPVITRLKSGRYLVTYRFNQGKFVKKRVHGHNIMGCLLTKEDMLETNRDNIESRIFPIDYDRNKNASCGYTGVVQFDDGEIYVVSHIKDDNPVARIRGYSFMEDDLIYG